MKKIFICYRTADAPYAATLIDQVLTPHFGPGAVFRAARSIDVGDDFEEKIFEAIRTASVALVVIGPNWLDARDENGRRLDDPDDMVRREIVTAFEHGVRVVPVLVNARRFQPGELPDALARLAKCQDIQINFRSSEYDLRALVARLKRVLATVHEPATRSLLVVGLENAAERGNPYALLHTVVDDALTSAGLTPVEIVTADREDRVVAVVDTDLPTLLDMGVESLIAAVGRHNLVAHDRLRLGIAVHRGLVRRDDHGWSGAELTEAFGLLDAPEVRNVLARADRAQCALVVPDAVYRDLVAREHRDLNASAYAKLADVAGWVRIPGCPSPPAAADPVPEPPALPPLSHGVTLGGNLFQGNVIGHVDASVNREPHQRG
jgi:hypothetical protein